MIHLCEKKYFYVNDDGVTLARTEQNELQVRTMNIFQRILRALFGCYSDTHLIKVGIAARKATTDPTWSQAAKEKIVQIAKKSMNLPSSPDLFGNDYSWSKNAM